MEWMKHLDNVDGSENLLNHHRKYGSFSHNLKHNLQQDPTVSTIRCTSMLMTGLYPISKKLKHPSILSKYEEITKMWYTHIVEYYSAIK